MNSRVSTAVDSADFWARHRPRVKALAGLTLFVLAVVALHRRLFVIVASESYVHSLVYPIASPIDGNVELKVRRAGQSVQAGDVLALVVDELADETKVVALESQRKLLNEQVAAVEELRRNVLALGDNVRGRASVYRSQRVRQLELLKNETEARLAALEADKRARSETFIRTRDLAEQGISSSEELSKARREAEMAESSLRGVQAQLAEVQVVRDSLRIGGSLGEEGGTTHVYSLQRTDELKVQLMDLARRRAELEAQRSAVSEELAAERVKYEKRSRTELRAPVTGTVWRLDAGNQTHVNHGQPLLQLLDCTQFRVIAYLSERRFNSVAINAEAEIELEGSSRTYRGRVVQLLGTLAPEALNRVTRSSMQLSREDFAVAVESEELNREMARDCGVGRTASVRFR